MANLLLKVPNIKGETTLDSEHKEVLEVLSWSLEELNPGSYKKGSGGGTGGFDMKDMAFSRRVDSASPKLFKACAAGTHYEGKGKDDSIVFYARKSVGGETPQDYLVVTLGNAMISSYSTGGGEGGETPVEDITIDFATIFIEYKKQQPNGTLATAATAKVDMSGGQVKVSDK